MTSTKGRIKQAVKPLLRHLPALQLARRVSQGQVRTSLLRLADRQADWQPRDFVDAPTGYGFSISGNTADYIQRHIYVFGVWDPSLSRWVSESVQEGDVVIDIGANIGYFSLLASRCVGETGRVLAFEPVPRIVQLLRRNVEANGATNVTVTPVALGREEGEIQIYQGSDSNLGQSSTMAGPTLTSAGAVKVKRASEAIPEELWPRIRLVKIDVEGDEFSVLQGMAPTLDLLPTGSAVLAELTPDWLAARGQSMEAAMTFMRERGFTPYEIAPAQTAAEFASERAPEPQPLATTPTQQTDVLFIKANRAD